MTVAARIEQKWRSIVISDRLMDKVKRAAAIAKQSAERIEARADGLLERGETIEKRTEQVFSQHEAVLDTADEGLNEVENALRLMGNDPLVGSESSDEKLPLLRHNGGG